MWPFKTQQQKIDSMVDKLAGKCKKMTYLQSLGRLASAHERREMARTWEQIGVLKERIRNLTK